MLQPFYLVRSYTHTPPPSDSDPTAPDGSLIAHTPSLDVTVGGSAVLECAAAGVPPESIQWSREDNTSLPARASVLPNGALSITGVTVEDEGVYLCASGPGDPLAMSTLTIRGNDQYGISGLSWLNKTYLITFEQ